MKKLIETIKCYDYTRKEEFEKHVEEMKKRVLEIIDSWAVDYGYVYTRLNDEEWVKIDTQQFNNKGREVATTLNKEVKWWVDILEGVLKERSETMNKDDLAFYQGNIDTLKDWVVKRDL